MVEPIKIDTAGRTDAHDAKTIRTDGGMGRAAQKKQGRYGHQAAAPNQGSEETG